MSDSIKVAVRVRCFNDREKKIGSQLVVEMNDAMTAITDPITQKRREFFFDYSYWSFDKADPHYADNPKVFKDLGTLVLDNAWAGYNVCLFAYGQTGAGKSYSMVGYGEDKGIVPLALEEMFERIKRNDDENVQYTVEASMLEIYNEKIRDLFYPEGNPPGGLKVRDHPKTGPYVEDLKCIPVSSYDDVFQLMEAGTKARTVATTNMNKSSSRAHTIFQVSFTATTHDVETNKDSSRVSRINLVDLAGSERIDKTGASGDTMKEGININKSLSALGDCIEKLAKKAGATPDKAKGIHVPYRNSTLTWLLKQSLGGNAKTIMIAAISPASDNYEESLSTLRYADRAKQIKNAAVVNEDENAKIIRSLKQEIEILRQQLAQGGGGGGGAGGGAMTEEEKRRMEEEKKELAAMRERMRQNEEIMKRMNMTWEEKMRDASQQQEERQRRMQEDQLKRKTVSHFVNLHQDNMLAETLAYFFMDGTTRVVRNDCSPPPGPQDMVLAGLLIQKDHALIINREGICGICPGDNARVFVNGQLVKEPTELHHQDRVILGAHHVFRFVDPTQRLEGEEQQQSIYDWSFAQKELTEQAMSSLQPLPLDEKQIKEKEEAERKMLELEERIEREKEAARKQQEQRQEEYARKLRELEELRKRELEEARRRMEQEGDIKAHAELVRVMQEKEEELRKQKEREQHDFERVQEEMKAKAQDLEKQLKKQQEETQKLARKREVENRDKVLLEEALMRTIPMINEANAICEELKQELRFQIKLVAKKSTDVNAFTERTEVFAKVMDLKEDVEVFWDQDAFAERLFLMREVYNTFLESQRIEIPHQNPFRIEASGPQLLGNSRIYLQPNFYLFPIEEKTPIIDYKGESRGQLFVRLLPVPPKDSSSNSIKDSETLSADACLFEEENVEELKNELLEIRLEVVRAMGLPTNYSHGVHCKYKFFLDEDYWKSEPTKETSINQELHHTRTIIIDPVTEEFIEYLRSGLMEIQVWGQRPQAQQPERGQLAITVDGQEDESRASSAMDSRAATPSPEDDESRRELEQASKLLDTFDGGAKKKTHKKSISARVEDLIRKAEDMEKKAQTLPERDANLTSRQSKQRVLTELEQSRADTAAKQAELQRVQKQLAEQEEKMKQEIKRREDELAVLRAKLQGKTGPGTDTDSPRTDGVAGQGGAGYGGDAEADRLRRELQDKEKRLADLEHQLATQKKSKACVIL